MSNEQQAGGFDAAILEKLGQLQEKYAAMGQDLNSYLDGLLYADYRTYWDLIHLDTLLSLQRPQTPFHDEVVFIVYHQITELYFKLTLHEFELMSQQAREGVLTDGVLLERVRRVNRYFEALTTSFDIMVDGMDPKEFMKFRMSCFPPRASKAPNTGKSRCAQRPSTASSTTTFVTNTKTMGWKTCPN